MVLELFDILSTERMEISNFFLYPRSGHLAVITKPTLLGRGTGILCLCQMTKIITASGEVCGLEAMFLRY